jgi:hypothetical protein
MRTDDERAELALAWGRSHDAGALAEDLVGRWRRGDDSLAFRATLEPYAGVVVLAILWGDVVPAPEP